MFDLKLFFALLSSLIFLLAFFPYLREISRKEIKPHIVSWLGWGFVTGLAAVAMYSDGFSWGFVIVAVNSLGCFTTAILSIVKKVGVWQTGWYDYFFFAAGITGIILWQVFDNPSLAVIFAVLADIMFGLPTAIKVYKDPKSESIRAWALAALSGFIALFSISYISFVQIAYPVYLLIYDGFIFVVLFLGNNDLFRLKK